jgi:hypothetical protein
VVKQAYFAHDRISLVRGIATFANSSLRRPAENRRARRPPLYPPPTTIRPRSPPIYNRLKLALLSLAPLPLTRFVDVVRILPSLSERLRLRDHPFRSPVTNLYRRRVLAIIQFQPGLDWLSRLAYSEKPPAVRRPRRST